MKLLRRVLDALRPKAAGPPPAAWADLLAARTTFFARLSAAQREELLRLMQRFIATKRFFGNGIAVTEEMKVVVAGTACLLLLGLPQYGLFPRNPDVIIHVRDFGQVVQAVGPDGQRYEIRESNLGQAIYRGPIRLAWSTIDAPAAHRRGRNLILHEYAHALDFLNGLIDGTPPLETRQRAAEWARVFSGELQRLRSDAAAGRPTLLDPYGATNPAELFAVATECFFEQPVELRRRHAELYAQLAAFYGQDPASTAERTV
jgi:Mlc titration factor MtfA (ptsG expression regulator)